MNTASAHSAPVAPLVETARTLAPVKLLPERSQPANVLPVRFDEAAAERLLARIVAARAEAERFTQPVRFWGLNE